MLSTSWHYMLPSSQLCPTASLPIPRSYICASSNSCWWAKICAFLVFSRSIFPLQILQFINSMADWHKPCSKINTQKDLHYYNIQVEKNYYGNTEILVKGCCRARSRRTGLHHPQACALRNPRTGGFCITDAGSNAIHLLSSTDVVKAKVLSFSSYTPKQKYGLGFPFWIKQNSHTYINIILFPWVCHVILVPLLPLSQNFHKLSFDPILRGLLHTRAHR